MNPKLSGLSRLNNCNIYIEQIITKLANKYWRRDLFLKTWRPYFWIIIVGFTLYFPTLFFNFTHLDDFGLIVENQFFLKNLSNIPLAFKQNMFNVICHSDYYYRPILTLSFMLDTQLGGSKPFIYHFSNVIFHLITSGLVYLFLCRLGYRKTLSFIATLVFTVHPALTQAIVWIPGRNDSLLAIFALAAFVFLINFSKQQKWHQAILHFLFFSLALFTKESAVALILVWLIYLGLVKSDKLPFKRALIIGIGWLMVLSIWFYFRNTASVDKINLITFSAILKSIFNGLPAIFVYLGKIIFPFNLTVFPIIQDSTKIYGVIAVAVIITLLAFSKRKRYNFIIFGLIWFLSFLSLSFVIINNHFFEHRLYFPIIGFIILLLEADAIKNLNLQKRTNLLIIILILQVLSIVTVAYSENFRNKLNFWQNAVKNSPHSAMAHRQLAVIYYLSGLLDESEDESRKALQLNPQGKQVHNNLGLIYMLRDMSKEAEEEFRKELKINPFYDTAYFNLGLIYYEQGNFEEAERNWKRAFEINPNCFNQTRAKNCIERLKKERIELPEFLKELKIN